jgi:hypothetical protein
MRGIRVVRLRGLVISSTIWLAAGLGPLGCGVGRIDRGFPGDCVPEADSLLCAAQNKSCGTMPDGCGGMAASAS